MIIMADKTKMSDSNCEGTPRAIQIGRPILQKATSSAESLISNAPGTGVSQTSILCKNTGKDKKKAKSVAFGDPLTLPSPTNPNKPPIIHQQLNEIHTDSNSPSPIPSESESYQSSSKPELYTQEQASLDEELRAPIALPESSKIRDSSTDTVKSKGDKSPDVEANSSKRSIDISHPVLKSEIGLKMNLIPINSPFLNHELQKSKRSSDSRHKFLSKTTDDFSSPRKSSSSKARPISIAIFHPVRPKSPPPPCPNQKKLSNGDVSRDDSIEIESYQCDLLQEILLEADKKVESETGETDLCSSIITPSKANKKASSHRHTWL